MTSDDFKINTWEMNFYIMKIAHSYIVWFLYAYMYLKITLDNNENNNT